MQTSWEKPTGILVYGKNGEESLLSFPAFVEAIQKGVIGPDDEAHSRIVTSGQRVRVGDMRLFSLLQAEAARRDALAETPPEVVWPSPSEGIWPPPPARIAWPSPPDSPTKQDDR